MLNDQKAIGSTSRSLDNHHDHDQDHEEDEEQHIRDIHALTPPRPPLISGRARRREAWETSSTNRSSSLSMASTESENFTSISREFNALVLAGSTIADTNYGGENENGADTYHHHSAGNNNLGRIGEEETPEETNPLAIVPDNNPLDDPVPSPRRRGALAATSATGGSSSRNSDHHHHGEVTSVQRVKKEEVESKINAWQTAKIAKINNRFKREDAVINGWESEEVQKATSRMKKVERKLEEKRAKALEEMQNGIAKARRKAEERRASAEAKRGTKVAKVMEISNLMKAVGKPPAKRSFF